MNVRQIQLQARKLTSHVVDGRGHIEPKMVRAVAKAISGSKWPHKAILLRQFSQQVLRIEANQTATVVSAEKLSESDKGVIEKLIKQKHSQVDTIDWQIQTGLLAGITVKTGDIWYDLSLQQRLSQVQEYLG